MIISGLENPYRGKGSERKSGVEQWNYPTANKTAMNSVAATNKQTLHVSSFHQKHFFLLASDNSYALNAEAAST